MRHALLFLIAFAGLCPAARGQPILYSNFGPGDSFGTGSRVVGEQAGLIFQDAMPFSPTATGPVGTIRVPVLNFIAPNAITFTLRLDNAGNPGTALESWSMAGLSTSAAGDSSNLRTMTSTVHPVLTAGTNYWLVASTTGSVTRDGWFIDNQGVDGFKFSTDGGATWTPASGTTTQSAYEIAAFSPVPEPGSMALVARVGLAALGWRWRRRRVSKVPA